MDLETKTIVEKNKKIQKKKKKLFIVGLYLLLGVESSPEFPNLGDLVHRSSGRFMSRF
jgi:hypothetical protein